MNATQPRTVRDLINTLAQCNQDAIVTLGHAPGPLGHITETVNGFVILDCGPPLGAVHLQVHDPWSGPACDPASGKPCTTVRGDVTCGACKQTPAWAEHARPAATFRSWRAARSKNMDTQEGTSQ